MKNSRVLPCAAFAAALMLWEAAVRSGHIASYLLPAPSRILKTLAIILPQILPQIYYTLSISAGGFLIAFVLAVIIAVVMDLSETAERIFYPALILSQTIPVIAIAPLFVLWFGYGALPKLLLIISICFFPITVNLLAGFKSADRGMLDLVRCMGAGPLRTFWLIKIPSALENMFSGLKIAATYCITGAVISEWLGGDHGLGVYMIRVKRSFSYDKMFAAVIIIVALSILLVKFIDLIQKMAMPYKNRKPPDSGGHP